jgi:flavorubredoxin
MPCQICEPSKTTRRSSSAAAGRFDLSTRRSCTGRLDVTWLESEKTVFTCDFLGTHFCEPTITDRRIGYLSLYESAFADYYNAIFSPFKPYVLKGLEKLDELDIETLCPSHGPVLHKDALLGTARDLYETWSVPTAEEVRTTIPVFYCSAYGYTSTLAGEIAQGILHVLPDAEVPIYDLTVHEPSKLACLINENDAFCIGSPTINKDALPPAWALINHTEAIGSKGKKAAVFGSYGWRGEGVPALISRLNLFGIKTFEDGYRCRFKPSDEERTAAFDFGARFAESLKQTEST